MSRQEIIAATIIFVFSLFILVVVSISYFTKTESIDKQYVRGSLVTKYDISGTKVIKRWETTARVFNTDESCWWEAGENRYYTVNGNFTVEPITIRVD